MRRVLLAGLLAASLAPLVAPSSAPAQRAVDTLPSIARDDPARLLRPADLPDIEDLLFGFGAVFGPADFASIAEPPFLEELEADERVERLEELGWLSHAQANFGLLGDTDSSQFVASVVSEITRFASPQAAEEAFDVIEDESFLPDAEDEDAPREFGSPSEITVIRLSPGEVFRNLTFLVDDAHVNVSVAGSRDAPELDDELLIEAGELMRERMDIDTDDLPGLAAKTLHVDSGDEPLLYSEAGYLSVGGDNPRDVSDSDETFANRTEALAEADDAYASFAGVSSGANLVVRVYDTTDDAAAETLLEGFAEENPSPTLFTSWRVVDSDEVLGDQTVTAEFAYEIDDEEYTGHAVLFRVDDVVARVEVDGPEDYGIEAALLVAEAQLSCIEDDGCELFAIPDALSTSPDEGPLGPTGGDEEDDRDA